MGIFSQFFGRKNASQAQANLPGPGLYGVDVVGESKYQTALESICGGRTDASQEKVVVATLIYEHDNPHDDKAVRVEIEGRTVGYLDRANARQYRSRLSEAGYPEITATCSAVIVGGWDRGGDDRGHFGVRLDLPTAD